MSVSKQAQHAHQHLSKLGSKKLLEFLSTRGPRDIPTRYGEDPMIGLCRIVVGQQISGAAATKIWQSLEAQTGSRMVLFERLGQADPTLMGLSASKRKTLQHIVLMGELEVNKLAQSPMDNARERLLAIPGIGPWTVSMWQLFVQQAPDCWSDNDLILKRMSDELASECGIERSQWIERARPYRSYLALACWALKDA